MKNNAVRILVVDDDIDLLMLLERKLKQQGYCVESAGSLAEAEYVSSQFKPHLSLIDINIGGDDGRQLCWKIKHATNQQNTKVILMSALYYPTTRTLLFGADDFIAKPFVTEFLLQRINAQLQEEPPVPVVMEIPSEELAPMPV
jgi:DNA-binding response OmpR family regulator